MAAVSRGRKDRQWLAMRRLVTSTSHFAQLSDEEVRIGMGPAALRQAVADHLRYSIGRLPSVASRHDYYRALALAVRDRMQDRWTDTTSGVFRTGPETRVLPVGGILLGPHLGNNLVNLDLEQAARTAMAELGQTSTSFWRAKEPGLGNGGLGRLAACYLDSLATLQRPAIGYGIRYEFGSADQEIRDGWQAEVTDKWLRYGNPWRSPSPRWRTT